MADLDPRRRHMLLAMWEVANGQPQARVARERPVSQAALSRAMRRKTYTDLPDPDQLRGIPFEQALRLAENHPPPAYYRADVERVAFEVLPRLLARRLMQALGDLPDPARGED